MSVYESTGDSHSRFQSEVAKACVDWYKSPPKPIPSSITVGDERERLER
ncbi:DUF2026 family protein [Pseudomonas cichorii]